MKTWKLWHEWSPFKQKSKITSIQTGIMADNEFHKIPDEVIHENMVLKKHMVDDAFSRMENLQTTPEDIIIATYPRSGTTWTAEMASLILHDGDVKRMREKTHPERVLYLECKVVVPPPINLYYGVAIAELMAGTPRFMKTHLPYKYIRKQVEEYGTKTILVFRNIRDVLVSFYNFYKTNGIEFGNYEGTWDEFFEMFLNKPLMYGDWLEHFKSYWPIRDRENVHVIFYEDTIDDLEGTVLKLAKFLGKDLQPSSIQNIVEHCSFSAMQRNSNTIWLGEMAEFAKGDVVDTFSKNFFREGGYGKWRKYFSKEQDEYIKMKYDAKLPELGVTFRF